MASWTYQRSASRQSTWQFSQWAVVAGGAAAIAAVFSAWFRWQERARLQEWFDSVNLRTELAWLDAAGRADNAQLAAGVVFLVLLVSLAFVGHSALRQAKSDGAEDLPVSPGWAAAGWFIPVVNFVLGPAVMSTTSKVTNTRDRPIGISWRTTSDSALSITFGALWFLSSVSVVVAGTQDVGLGPATRGEFLVPTTWNLIGAGLLCCAALAAAFWANQVGTSVQTVGPRENPYLPTLTSREILNEARVLPPDEQAIVARAIPSSLGPEEKLIAWFVADVVGGRATAVVGLLNVAERPRESDLRWINWQSTTVALTRWHRVSRPVCEAGLLRMTNFDKISDPRPQAAVERIAALWSLPLVTHEPTSLGSPAANIEPDAPGGVRGNSATASKLRELQDLLDQKLIKPEEYDQMRSRVIQEFS